MEKTQSATATLTSDREIVMTREFDAPRTLVFDAWTKPEHVTHWWDPDGAPLALCEIDLRPEGRFQFVNQGPGGHGHRFAGTYREIVRPSRLVFTTPISPQADSVGTLVFTEQQGRTTLTMTIECPSKEARDALLKMRVDVGTSRTLDNLVEYLGTIGQDRQAP